MARGVNKSILLGNCGGDPDTKYTGGGMAVTRISLATTSVRNDRDGNKQERTEWHRLVFFGKLGEIAGEYLRKGMQIYVEGEIRYDKFTGQDGVEKYTTDIVVSELQMLGGRDSGGGSNEDRGGRDDRSQRDNRGSGNSGSSGGNRGGGGGGSRGGAPQRQRPERATDQRHDDFAQDDDIPFLSFRNTSF